MSDMVKGKCLLEEARYSFSVAMLAPVVAGGQALSGGISTRPVLHFLLVEKTLWPVQYFWFWSAPVVTRHFPLCTWFVALFFHRS